MPDCNLAFKHLSRYMKWGTYSILIIIVLLTIADVVHQTGIFLWPRSIYQILNFASEHSVDDWLGAILWYTAGLLCFALSEMRGHYSRPTRFHVTGWRILALGFIFLGFDDAVAFHEAAGGVFTQIFGRSVTYSWHILYAPPALVALFLIGHLVYTSITDPRARILFVLSVGLNLLAVGMDVIEGLASRSGISLLAVVSEQSPSARHWLKVVEEILETVAILLLILALYAQVAALGGKKESECQDLPLR